MRSQPFEQHALQYFRRILFPAITRGVISGYNVYHQHEESTAPYTVSYLHSDLGLLPNGKPQPHLEELADKLTKFGPPTFNQSVINTILDRIAVYKIGKWRKNPKGLLFYDAKGEAIDLSSLRKNKKQVIISEGVQYDLSMGVKTQHDLEKIISVLDKYSYATKRGKDGKILTDLNPDSITGAWEIPLILITQKNQAIQHGFLPVTEITIAKDHYQGKTLITNLAALRKHKIKFNILKKLVNEPFVVSYLDVLH